MSAKHLLKSPHAGPQNAEDNKKAVSLLQLTACFCCGAPEEIRTPGLQVRSLLLYPAELRAHKVGLKSGTLDRNRTHNPQIRSLMLYPVELRARVAKSASMG